MTWPVISFCKASRPPHPQIRGAKNASLLRSPSGDFHALRSQSAMGRGQKLVLQNIGLLARAMAFSRAGAIFLSTSSLPSRMIRISTPRLLIFIGKKRARLRALGYDTPAARPAEIGTLTTTRIPSSESPTLSINSAIAAAASVSNLKRRLQSDVTSKIRLTSEDSIPDSRSAPSTAALSSKRRRAIAPTASSTSGAAMRHPRCTRSAESLTRFRDTYYRYRRLRGSRPPARSRAPAIGKGSRAVKCLNTMPGEGRTSRVSTSTRSFGAWQVVLACAPRRAAVATAAGSRSSLAAARSAPTALEARKDAADNRDRCRAGVRTQRGHPNLHRGWPRRGHEARDD